MRRFPLIVTALLAIACVLPAQGAAWKWRDKSGQVHISDLPPPREVEDKDILQRPTPVAPPRVQPDAGGVASAPTPTAAPPATRVDPELEARRKQTEQEQADKRKKEEDQHNAKRAENCKHAKEALRSLESGIRIARVNEKGEREYLDDQTVAAEAKRARATVANECK